jgi:hypothetical protein
MLTQQRSQGLWRKVIDEDKSSSVVRQFYEFSAGRACDITWKAKAVALQT